MQFVRHWSANYLLMTKQEITLLNYNLLLIIEINFNLKKKYMGHIQTKKNCKEKKYILLMKILAVCQTF